jgi:hypothetical protein
VFFVLCSHDIIIRIFGSCEIHTFESLLAERAAWELERAELQKALSSGNHEIERLRRMIAALRKKLFGCGQSEKVDHEQLNIQLNLAEVELEQLQASAF